MKKMYLVTLSQTSTFKIRVQGYSPEDAKENALIRLNGLGEADLFDHRTGQTMLQADQAEAC